MQKLTAAIFIMFAAFSALANVTVVSQDTSISEKTAARRLVIYLKQMLGEDAVKLKKEAKSPAIYVGKSPLTAKMLGLKDFSSLKYEEIIIKSVGNDLVILGESKRGTLYAVYTYLEDFLGFRFWAWKEYDVPPAKNFKMSGINHRYNPIFTRRAMYHWPLIHLPAQWKSGDAEFAVICRMNSGLTHTTAKYGGGDYSAGFTHTFHRILPQNKYFKTHPEYYSLINGKRHPRAQLCLSNKEMRKVFIEEAKKYYIKNKGALAITVAHDDNGLFCECKPCKALLAREKGRMSGVEIDFVNEVAAALEKVYPGIMVETSAYGPTILPPLVTKPRKNVIIRYADMNLNPAFPFGHPENKEVTENFKAWANVSHQMAVWHYTTNAKNSLVPMPVMDSYDANFKFFRDNKVTNVFIEDSGTSMGLAHLNQLRGYITSRMLWNPELDYNKLLVEFTDGYYGKKAGPIVREYIKLYHSPIYTKIPGHEIFERIKKGYFTEYYLSRSKSYQTAQKNSDALVVPPVVTYFDHALGFMPRETLIQCVKLLDKACEAAENEKFKDRIRDARFAIRIALLTDYDIAAAPEKFGFTAQYLKDMANETFAEIKRLGNQRMGLANSPFTMIENQISRIHELNKKTIPDFLKNVNSKNLEFFNYKDWSLMIPKRAFVINDRDSYDGKAYSMVNTPPSWALQCRNITTSVRPGKYKIYLRFRMVPKKGVTSVKPGIFFNAAYYVKNKAKKAGDDGYKASMIRAKTEDFKDGKYHWKYAGIHEISTSSAAYFFADPCNHPDVEAIVIDQLLLQRID